MSRKYENGIGALRAQMTKTCKILVKSGQGSLRETVLPREARKFGGATEFLSNAGRQSRLQNPREAREKSIAAGGFPP